MPLEVERLSNASGTVAARDAISKSIAQCMREPIPEGYDVKDEDKQKWCAAKAYNMARERTGQEMPEGGIQ